MWYENINEFCGGVPHCVCKISIIYTLKVNYFNFLMLPSLHSSSSLHQSLPSFNLFLLQ